MHHWDWPGREPEADCTSIPGADWQKQLTQNGEWEYHGSQRLLVGWLACYRFIQKAIYCSRTVVATILKAVTGELDELDVLKWERSQVVLVCLTIVTWALVITIFESIKYITASSFLFWLCCSLLHFAISLYFCVVNFLQRCLVAANFSHCSSICHWLLSTWYIPLRLRSNMTSCYCPVVNAELLNILLEILKFLF